MSSDVQSELRMMHDKLTHYGQFIWLNIILTVWDKAYKDAYKNVSDVWGKRKIESTLEILILGILIGSQPLKAQLILGPMLYGLSKVLDKPKTLPATVVGAPEELIYEHKMHFGQLLAHCSRSILDLYDKKPDLDEFLAFRSRALLSPIWYPPVKPDVGELTKKIQRRLWAKLLLELKSGQLGYDIKKQVQDVKVPSDDVHDVDLFKYQELRRTYRPYKLGRHTDSTVELFSPIYYEFSRPEPLSYKLPKRVQDIADKTKTHVAAMTGGGYFSPTPDIITTATERAMLEVPKTLRLDWSHVPPR